MPTLPCPQASRGPRCTGIEDGRTSSGQIPSNVTQHTWLAIWNILITAMKRGILEKQYQTL